MEEDRSREEEVIYERRINLKKKESYKKELWEWKHPLPSKRDLLFTAGEKQQSCRCNPMRYYLHLPMCFLQMTLWAAELVNLQAQFRYFFLGLNLNSDPNPNTNPHVLCFLGEHQPFSHGVWLCGALVSQSPRFCKHPAVSIGFVKYQLYLGTCAQLSWCSQRWSGRRKSSHGVVNEI